MAKEITINNKGKKNLVAMLTEKCNKKGELRGNNKKDTKNLKEMCVHHRLNKKGKVKPQITSEGGRCHCKMCSSKFPTLILKQDKLVAIQKPYKEYINQAKFMATAADLGDDAIQFLAKYSVDSAKFIKLYGKIANAVEKHDSVKKKKKNKGGNGGGSGSSSYGSWG